MKKRTVFLLTAICLTAILASCHWIDRIQAPTDAASAWKRIDQTMGALSSYEESSVMSIVFYQGGEKVESLMNTVAVVFSDPSDAYYYYAKMEGTIESKGLDYKEKMTRVEAYHNGTAFIANEASGTLLKLCSPMTAEDYEEYLNSSSVMHDIDMMDCTNADLVKNADNTYTITLSGYTKKTVAAFMKGTDFDKGLFDHDILDMEITLKADSQFRAAELNLTLIFDVEETELAKPILTMTSTFGKYNEAAIITDGLDPASYTEIDDIRILDRVTDGIEAHCDATNGSFTLKLKQCVTVADQNNIYEETDHTTYGKKNGDYFYDIKADTSSGTITIHYQNGIQTVTQDGQSQTASQSEDDARAYIEYLVNTANYDSTGVAAVEKISEGVYQFQLEASNSATYEQIFASMNATLTDADQTITVTFADDVITSIKSSVTCKGTLKQNNSSYPVTFTIESENIFHPLTNSDSSDI